MEDGKNDAPKGAFPWIAVVIVVIIAVICLVVANAYPGKANGESTPQVKTPEELTAFRRLLVKWAKELQKFPDSQAKHCYVSGRRQGFCPNDSCFLGYESKYCGSGGCTCTGLSRTYRNNRCPSKINDGHDAWVDNPQQATLADAKMCGPYLEELYETRHQFQSWS